jgi:hypothetical protein
MCSVTRDAAAAKLVAAFAVVTVLCAGTANAAYVHSDPAGVAHPGCIRSEPHLVSRHHGGIKSANQSCPGAPMIDVWDFERDLYPFNLERARDTFDAFFAENDLTAGNDFNTPTFSDYREPGNPPTRGAGYTRPGSKYWKYKFPWQTKEQSKTTSSFNMDIALEQINMTIIKEGLRLVEYLAENDCETVDASTLASRLDSAMRDDFDRAMRYRFPHRWRCAGYENCEPLTEPETTLGFLNDELERLMTLRNRTLERANLDAYRSNVSRATGPYSFLKDEADDLDLCIHDLSSFNANVTAQVRKEYARQQHSRFVQFLRLEKYDDLFSPNGTGTITASTNVSVQTWNENVARLNALVEHEVKARYVRDLNRNISDWIIAKNATTRLYGNIVGAVVTDVSPDAAKLNDLIENQVASAFVAETNAAFARWKVEHEYDGFLNIAAIDSKDFDIAAINADSERQAKADWVSRASANHTAWRVGASYGYVAGVSVESVEADLRALNLEAEKQVEAEWVKNAQDDFYDWLVRKGYTEFVSNDTASIKAVHEDIDALNAVVESALEAAHIADSQDEFQSWLTARSYAHVTGVAINEVNEDIDAVNLEVETQVKQKWVADAEAALQRWLAARGLGADVAITRPDVDLDALNAEIDSQTVTSWVNTENDAIKAWRVSKGYDSVVTKNEILLNVSDESARADGYSTHPDALNSLVKRAWERDWIDESETELRTWLDAKRYSDFIASSDVSIRDTNPNVASLNAIIQTKVEKKWISDMNAEVQAWLAEKGYGDVTAIVDQIEEDFDALNVLIKEQAELDWVNSATAELASYIAANEYGFITVPSITSVSEDLEALRADVASQVNDRWVADADASLKRWVIQQGYNQLVSVGVSTPDPDFESINAVVRAAVATDYLNALTSEILNWVTENDYASYFDASADAIGEDADAVAEAVEAINESVSGKFQREWVVSTNVEFQNWLAAEYGRNVTDLLGSSAVITSVDQDMAALNALVESAALQVDPRAKDYEPFDPVPVEDFTPFQISEAFSYEAYAPLESEAPEVPAFAPSRGAFGTYVTFEPSRVYGAYENFQLSNGAYPGFSPFTVAASFPALDDSFAREALGAYEPFASGVRFSGYTPFHLTDGPYPGYVPFEVRAFAFTNFTAEPYPRYVDFHPPAYPAYVPFEMAPAFSHAPYVHLREHVFVPYALRTPNHSRYWTDRYDRYSIRDPDHIDKHDMTKLFYYHKAWYYQEYSVCRPTCVGTMGPNTETDTDALAEDRVCDADDHLCPKSNDPSKPGTNVQGTWEEFNLIVEARTAHHGKHPRCPVSDPCRTSPPPCFYVTTACIPDVVVDTRINNTALREREDRYNNEDEKYLHEPMKVADIVDWKLVSSRLDTPGRPKFWNYWSGLDMAPYTSPRDGEVYHKVCTFALVQKHPAYFERGVEYGFSIAERLPKIAEGHTQAGQNSYRAPNHVYDVGHIGDLEKWQRSFGETVSPLLDDSCSGTFAGDWRNRKYAPAQQFGSVAKVWGTCAETCSSLSSRESATSTVLATLGRVQIEASLGNEKDRSVSFESQFSYWKHARVAIPVFAAAAAAAGVLVRGKKTRAAAATHSEAEKVPLLTKDETRIPI